MGRKAYIYETHTAWNSLTYFSFSTLAQCVKQVEADKKAGLPAGTIYVRYNRCNAYHKALVKTIKELERELAIRQNEARARLAEIALLNKLCNELRRETQG